MRHGHTSALHMISHEQEAQQRVITHLKEQQNIMRLRLAAQSMAVKDTSQEGREETKRRNDDSQLDVIQEESPEKNHLVEDVLSSKVHVLRRLYHQPQNPSNTGEGELGRSSRANSTSQSREEQQTASALLLSGG